MAYNYTFFYTNGMQTELKGCGNRMDLNDFGKKQWVSVECPDGGLQIINMSLVLTVKESIISEQNEKRGSWIITPLSDIAAKINNIDEQETEKRRREHPSWHTQKSGYAKRFTDACNSLDIHTLGELLKLGKREFRRADKVGAILMDALDDVLFSEYSISNW